jgi:hypothetical protein
MIAESERDRDFSVIIISLLKGVLYREEDPVKWNGLMTRQSGIRDYMGVMGLELRLHEDEGFAYLARSLDDSESGNLPPLVSRRQLSYPVSLLLALLRERLAEQDSVRGYERLILSRDEIIGMIKTFLPSGTNEVKIIDQIDSYINKTVDLGFLRRMKSEGESFEVRRILKVFIDAQWLSEFSDKLNEYIRVPRGTGESEEAIS